MKSEDNLNDATITVLSEEIKHHVEEDEEAAKDGRSAHDVDLVALRGQVLASKGKLLAEASKCRVQPFEAGSAQAIT